jgi:hypothetical protein
MLGQWEDDVNIDFVPYVNGVLKLAETSVTEQHCSVRKRQAAVHK